jgi:hypothetical protein
VSLLSWEEYVMDLHYQRSSKVTYRHLEVDFTDQMLTDLEKFVEGVQGKSYHLSAKKLLLRTDDEREGYFCSQLVASAYKSLGLLPRQIPSCSFWPGDFSCRRVLSLKKAAYLTEEQVIDFS